MFTCAVIGAGASGISVVYQLTKWRNEIADFSPLKIYLIEKRKKVGGIAFSTECPTHLLNTLALHSSIDPDHPTHFSDWMQRKDFSFDPNSYAKRRDYRDYLESIVHQIESMGQEGSTLERIWDEAQFLSQNEEGFVLKLKSGKMLEADFVVLAMGNYPPPSLSVNNHWFASNPYYWGSPYEAFNPDGTDVLIVGTGLSMVDQALQLRANRYAGKVHALSRHGLIPPAPFFDPQELKSLPEEGGSFTYQTLVEWFRFFKNAYREGKRSHLLIGGRYLLEKFRSGEDSFSPEEWSRYERHASTYANLLAHPIPKQSRAEIEEMIRMGQLILHSGTLLKIEPANRFKATYRTRYGGEKRNLEVGCLVNCLGPAKRFSACQDPFLTSLLNTGFVRPTQDRFIMDRSPKSFEVLDKGGNKIDNLFAVGALCKSMYGSTTNLGVLALEAKQLSKTIVQKIAALSFANQFIKLGSRI